MTKDEMQSLIISIRASDKEIWYDTFYYLLTQLDSEERDTLKSMLEVENEIELTVVLEDAIKGWSEYGKSMGEVASDASEIEHLKFHLGRVKYFSEPRQASVMFTTDYYGFGARYWEQVKNELYNALCSDSTEYEEQKKELRERGGALVTVAIPAIMSILGLPASLAGIAIVVSVFISKVGFNALCSTLKLDMETSGENSK